MNKLLVSISTCAAVAAVPLLSLAQSQPSDVALMKVPTNAVSYMCRNAGPNEKPTGTIGAQAVVCKSSSAAIVGGMMKVPKTAGLSGPDTDKAWRDWLYQVLDVRSGDG